MIHSGTSRLNESFLHVLSVQNTVTAQNIANVDTPNYKRKAVVFEEELRSIIDKKTGNELEMHHTHAKHIPLKGTGEYIIPYKIVEQTDTKMNINGNNVDLDAEMAKLSENQLMYNFMIDRVSGHYTKYKELLQSIKS